MAQKKIETLIDRELSRHHEINMITSAIAVIAANLQTLPPEVREPIAAMANHLPHDIMQLRRNNLDATRLFSGHGDIAKVIQHRIAELQAINFEGNQGSEIRELVQRLQQYNYRPITAEEQIKRFEQLIMSTGDFLRQCVGYIPGQPMPYYPKDGNIAVTGIHQKNDTQDASQIFLQITVTIPVPNGKTSPIISVSVDPLMQPIVMLYHPLEKIWVQYDGTMLLPNMISEVEKAFGRIQAAVYASTEENFDFNTQLKAITNEYVELFTSSRQILKHPAFADLNLKVGHMGEIDVDTCIGYVRTHIRESSPEYKHVSISFADGNGLLRDVNNMGIVGQRLLVRGLRTVLSAIKDEIVNRSTG